MEKAADVTLTEHSDVDSAVRVTKHVVARALNELGPDAPPGVLTRAIDLVRAIGDRSFSVGDCQVEQMHAASDGGGTSIAEFIDNVDHMDRCTVLRHVTRMVVITGPIDEDRARFLEAVGRTLRLAPDQVEHVVIGVITG